MNPIISRERLVVLIQKLKEENSRSMFLAALPGDFNRVRNRLDLSVLNEFDPDSYAHLLLALVKGEKIAYRPTNLDMNKEVQEVAVQKKLARLFDIQKIDIAERGYNPVRVGYPIVVQKTSSSSTSCFSCPLLIWNLEIEFNSSSKTWTLKFEDAPPAKNHSLESLIKSGMIKLELSSFEDLDWEKLVANGRWEVLEKATSKLIKDNPQIRHSEESISKLIPIPYRTKRELMESSEQGFEIELWNSAIMGKYSTSRVAVIKDLEHFSEGIPPFQVPKLPKMYLGANDLDPSQASVFKRITQGKHIVLHGPPGTGKSQTITGLVSSAAAKGLKVAVICQKLAALEIIEKNLLNLKLSSGIVKITDVSQGRKDVVNIARDRYDICQSNDSIKGELKKQEDLFRSESSKLDKAKVASSTPILGSDNVIDLIGILSTFKRDLGEDFSLIWDFKPGKKKVEKLLEKMSHFVEEAGRIQLEFDEVLEALPLMKYVKRQVNSINLDSEIRRLSKICFLLTEVGADNDRLTSLLSADLDERKNLFDSYVTTLKTCSDRVDGYYSKYDQIRSKVERLQLNESLSLVDVSKELKNHIGQLESEIETLLAYQNELGRFQSAGTLGSYANPEIITRFKLLFSSRIRSEFEQFKTISRAFSERGLKIHEGKPRIESLQRALSSVEDIFGELLSSAERHKEIEDFHLSDAVEHIAWLEVARKEIHSKLANCKFSEHYKALVVVREQFDTVTDSLESITWLSKLAKKKILADVSQSHQLVDLFKSQILYISRANQLKKDILTIPIPQEWLSCGKAPMIMEAFLINEKIQRHIGNNKLLDSDQLIIGLTV